MDNQLCFFKESVDIQVEKKLKEIEDRHLRTSKSQYAKIAELMKIIVNLKDRIETFESAISRSGIEISLDGQVTFHTMKRKA